MPGGKHRSIRTGSAQHWLGPKPSHWFQRLTSQIPSTKKFASISTKRKSLISRSWRQQSTHGIVWPSRCEPFLAATVPRLPLQLPQVVSVLSQKADNCRPVRAERASPTYAASTLVDRRTKGGN